MSEFLVADPQISDYSILSMFVSLNWLHMYIFELRVYYVVGILSDAVPSSTKMQT